MHCCMINLPPNPLCTPVCRSREESKCVKSQGCFKKKKKNDAIEIMLDC